MIDVNLDIELLPHQLRFVNSDKPFTAMVCGRGAGKTYVASYLAVLKAMNGERVILFAQNWASLTENLMKECTIRLVELEKSISDLIGVPYKINYRYNQGGQKITFGDSNGVIYGATYPSQESIRGYSRISTLILDEAALSKPDILQVAQPCMRDLPAGQHPRTYAITTPKAGSWFNILVLDKLEKDPDSIELIQAKSKDNFKISEEEYEAFANNFTSEALKRQELGGELLNLQAENSILSDIKYKIGVEEMPEYGTVSIGIDGSGWGKDQTVITYRIGHSFIQKCYDKLTGTDCRNEVKMLLAKYPKWNIGEINIDMAYGEKYYENLNEEYENVSLINFGSKSEDEQYLNKRAEMYFELIKAMKNGLPITQEIEKELIFTLFEFTQNGKIKLIPKDEIKEVIKHSPDKSDSLALTFALGDRSNYNEKCEETYYIDPED